ncbi:hypothetical protein Q1695_014487 [Nippostrongylus brasiliensis]|nr:hypothetical protein Q1695_014487 [Nippostrongylus brasiliensis]
MILLLLLAITGLVVSQRCGHAPIAPREHEKIIGGVEARPYSWPWQVELCSKSIFSKRCDLRCGGTLIDDEWVMSAGHCVRHYEDNPRMFGIKLGTYDFRDDDEEGEELRDVAEIHVHPKFGTPHPFSFDISLLRLAKPVNFTKHIQPICVARSLERISENMTGYVTGWGSISEGGPVSNKLRQVVVPFLSNKECEKEYHGEIDETMTCAGRQGIDSCQGDSGGPLVQKHEESGRWYQAGIVSWGQGCGEPGHAGVYARPSANCEFLEKYTGMILLTALLLAVKTQATPSVWSCPLAPLGPLPAIDFRLGESCPRDSFLHYYACCDDNPYQCCFHFETWAVVVFAMICLGALAALLFFSGKLILAQR